MSPEFRNYPCRVIVANGDIKECLLTMALVDGTRQSVASITDLSAQKELERQIARIGEEERRHMGRFLYDDLGSHLAGVEPLSSLLSSRLSKSDHPDTELALEIKALINQAVKKKQTPGPGACPGGYGGDGVHAVLLLDDRPLFRTIIRVSKMSRNFFHINKFFPNSIDLPPVCSASTSMIRA